MSHKLDHVPLIVVTALFIGGCVFGWRKKDATETNPQVAPPAASAKHGQAAVDSATGKALSTGTATARDSRVQPVWQTRMLEELDQKADKFVEAWGLFSEGGWSDAGQVIVFANADRSQTRLILVAPNKREVSRDRALTKEEWQILEPHTKAAQGLVDVNESVFDGLVFELVHVKREGNQNQVVKRLFVKQAGNQAHPEHDAVINAFQALKK